MSSLSERSFNQRLNTFPENVRVHQIVDYWYCSERSRLLACERLEAPKTERMGEGSEVHGWLENRPKTRKETELTEKLKPHTPFNRVYDGTKILAHPDDLAVLNKNKVQIVEYKTVGKLNVKPWKSFLHKLQVQLYCWVLEPTLEGLGYRLAHYHTVVYLKKNGVFLRRAVVEQDNFCVERQVREVFSFWKTGEPLVSPMKWKCQLCPEVFRAQCRVLQSQRSEAHE